MAFTVFVNVVEIKRSKEMIRWQAHVINVVKQWMIQISTLTKMVQK